MKDIIANLLKVKSLITILLTLTFCVGVFINMFMGVEIPPALINVYMVIVGFYFGRQTATSTSNEDILTYHEPDLAVGEAGVFDEIEIEEEEDGKD